MRVELDSSPAALELVNRRLLQLEIEAKALEREANTDLAAKQRSDFVVQVCQV